MLNYHWSFWIMVLLGILFLLWIFFGGGNHEFVGFAPLLPLSTEDLLIPEELSTSDIEEVCSFDLRREQEDLPEVITCPDETAIAPIVIIYDDEDAPTVPTPRNPSRWKRQEASCRSIEQILGKPFRRDVRDLPWLVNPETGANLEIDCYNDELKIGLEYNGEHHYKFPNRWNKTREEWMAMVRRDKLKPALCDNNGVYLVTIPYWVKPDQVKGEIRRQLEPLVKMRNSQVPLS